MSLETLLASSVTGAGISDSVTGFLDNRRLAEELNERGMREGERVLALGQQVIGTQRAQTGKSGVTSEGTPQELENATISKIHQETLRAAMPFFDRAAAIKGSNAANLISGITSAGISGLTTFALLDGFKAPTTDLLKSSPPSALHGPVRNQRSIGIRLD